MCFLSFLRTLREKETEGRVGVNMTHFKALFFSNYLWNWQGESYIGCYLYIGCFLLLRRLTWFCSFFWVTRVSWACQNCLRVRKAAPFSLPLPPLTCAVPSLGNLGSCSGCARCPHDRRTAENRLWGTRSVTLQEERSQAIALKCMCLSLLITIRYHTELKVLAELKNYPCFIRKHE